MILTVLKNAQHIPKVIIDGSLTINTTLLSVLINDIVIFINVS